MIQRVWILSAACLGLLVQPQIVPAADPASQPEKAQVANRTGGPATQPGQQARGWKILLPYTVTEDATTHIRRLARNMDLDAKELIEDIDTLLLDDQPGHLKPYAIPNAPGDPATQPEKAPAAARPARGPATQPALPPPAVGNGGFGGFNGQVVQWQVVGNVALNGQFVAALTNPPASQPAGTGAGTGAEDGPAHIAPAHIAPAQAGPVVAPATQPNGPLVLRGIQGGGQIVIQGGGQAIINGQVVVGGPGGIVQLKIGPAQPITPDENVPPQPPVGSALPIPAIPLPPSNPAETGVTVRAVNLEYSHAKIKGLTLTGEAGKAGLIQAERDSGEKLELKIEDVVWLNTQPGQDRPLGERMFNNANAVLLTNGEWLAGLIVGGDARQVKMAVIGVGELSIPLRHIRAVVTPAGRVGQNLVQLERALLTEKPAAAEGEEAAVPDAIKLANGETVSGTVIEINPKGLSVQGPAGNLKVDFDVLNVAELSNPIEPVTGADLPLAAWVELANGSRLLASRLDWRNGSMKITRVNGDESLSVPEQQIWSIETVNGRWRWLDALTPLVSRHTPFLTVRWPARFGVNVLGRPIKIGEKPYAHGVGVHSESTLAFAVKGATRFHCTAGLDVAAGPLAEVNVQVLLDGKVAVDRKSFKYGDAPLPVDLPLNGAQKLELRVGFGPNGDVQGRFDWADAALLY